MANPRVRRRHPLSPVQLAVLERLFTGGPMEASRQRLMTWKVLDREGFVQPCRLPGDVEAYELSGEGIYFMGGDL